MNDYGVDLEGISRRLFPYYLFVIFWAPIPFGSNRPWAWGLLALFCFALLFIYFWNFARENLRPPKLTADARVILLLLCTWILYQFAQVFPIPVELLNFISPKTVELKQQALGITDASLLALSFDVSNSWQAIAKSSIYAAIFFLTICLVNSRDKMRHLLIAIAFIGVLQAIWGLSVAFLQNSESLYSSEYQFIEAVKGTFVNRNHFGGFINIAIAATIGLMLCVGIKEKRQIHREANLTAWQSRTLDWRIYLVPYFGLLVLALIFCLSRGALAAFIVMLLAMGNCFVMVKENRNTIYQNFKWAIWLTILLLVFGGANFLSDQLAEINGDFNARMDLWGNSYHLIKDFWLTGVGSGNFQHVYPLYDSGEMPFRHSGPMPLKLIHAHNDYLELMAEHGAIGMILLGSVVLICLKNAFNAIRRFKTVSQSAYAIVAIMGASGFLAHAFVDFNFQIPSNALYFFVLLALGLLQGMDSVHHEVRDAVWEESKFNSRHSGFQKVHTRIAHPK